MITQVRYSNMYYNDVGATSPQVSCKSKGQHRFSLLVFRGCSSGSSIGLGWASILLRCLLNLSWMTSLT